MVSDNVRQCVLINEATLRPVITNIFYAGDGNAVLLALSCIQPEEAHLLDLSESLYKINS